MNVLFVFGGIPHYYAKLLDRLQSKGIDITVVIPDTDNSLAIGKGVKLSEDVHAYRTIRSKEKLSIYKKAYYPELAMILQREKPEIIVLGWPYFLQYFFDRKLRKVIRRRNIKFIIREIPFQAPPFGKIFSYFKQHPVYNESMQLISKGVAFYIQAIATMCIRKYCYRSATVALNYCSEAYKIIPSYGLSKDKVFVTYNATDNESLWRARERIKQEPLFLPENKQRILHIGRLVKWKRVDLLITAFAKALQHFPTAELVIVGDGPEKENLKQQCRNMQISDNVRFVEAVYDSYQLGKYMHESSIYVLAGMGGLSINDAMAYGLPVICSVCDGTEKDLVKEGYNGLFFEEGNVQSLEERINQLLASPELRTNMGAHSEEIIRTKINIESVSEHYIRAFEYAIKN